MRYFDDYQTIKGANLSFHMHGYAATRATIAISSVFAALAMGWALQGIGMEMVLRVLFVINPADC